MEKMIFRAKRDILNDWVYGGILPSSHSSTGDTYILTSEDSIDHEKRNIFIKVKPETVGVFVGFTAEKCKKSIELEIFEHDIFRGKDVDDNDTYFVVMWIEQRGAFYMVPVDHYEVIRNNDVSKEPEFEWLFQDAALYDFSIDVKLTKVGNIHDNPELLKI